MELNDINEDGFLEAMFSEILRMPLPVPEIVGSLDQQTYADKQSQNKAAKKEKVWKNCPICWTEFKRRDMVTTLICNEKHVFHTYCITEWIKKGHNSCPLCRLPIANL